MQRDSNFNETKTVKRNIDKQKESDANFVFIFPSPLENRPTLRCVYFKPQLFNYSLRKLMNGICLGDIVQHIKLSENA